MTDPRVGEAFLIDSNVLLDVITNDQQWAEWSASTLASCIRAGACYVNPIIYAEVSYGFDDVTALDDVLPANVMRRASIPYGAAFLAAKAHEAYRRRGGSRVATLPDFFIGAHAIVDRMTVVTRDARRYRQAFPGLSLVTPSLTG